MMKEEIKRQLIEEIKEHKFNTFTAEIALFNGNQKMSTVEEHTVIKADELRDYLTNLST